LLSLGAETGVVRRLTLAFEAHANAVKVSNAEREDAERPCGECPDINSRAESAVVGLDFARHRQVVGQEDERVPAQRNVVLVSRRLHGRRDAQRETGDAVAAVHQQLVEREAEAVPRGALVGDLLSADPLRNKTPCSCVVRTIVLGYFG